jgi:integrase
MPKPKRTRKPNARVRGQGSLFKRGDIFWFELNWKGSRTRRSLETPDRQTALIKLAEAVSAIRSGELPKTFEPVTVQSLYDVWIAEVERTCKPRTFEDYKSRWNGHLEPVFGRLFATQVTKDAVSKYLTDRKREGAGNITQNRENRVLQMLFNYNRKKISANDFPEFPEMHSEKNYVRKGRLSKTDFQTLLTRLEDPKNFWLKVIVVMTFRYGFRKNELLQATVSYFDAAQSVFTLPAYQTKNKTERRVPIQRDGEIYKMLVKLTEGRSPDAALFTRNGRPVKDYRGAWTQVTEGLTNGRGGHVMIHDLRRSAITEAKGKGLGAADFGTHLTPDVFARYVSRTESEEQANAAKVEGD